LLVLPLAATSSVVEVTTTDERGITELGIISSIAQADLVCKATVENCENDCLYHAGTVSRRAAIVYLDIRVTEVLYGWVPGPVIQVVVDGGSREDCPVRGDSRHPDPFEIGCEYLFFCYRPFSWEDQAYLAELHCRNGGVLCLNSDGTVEVCSGDLEFAMADPRAVYERYLAQIQPSQMFQAADVVVQATGFTLPAGEAGGNYKSGDALDKVISCVAGPILKGDLPDQSLSFERFSRGSPADQFFPPPIIAPDDEALLFLQRTDNGLALLWNGKGYCLLQEGRLLTNSGAPVGFRLQGGRLTKEPR